MSQETSIRIAAVGDIHVKENDKGKWKDYFEIVSEHADVLLLCGDLTDTGRKEEAQTLVRELKSCTIPVLAVLGNHDYESGMEGDVKEVLKEGLQLLDGDSVVIKGVGFAGIKGFSGGFNRYRMPAYGEEINKIYVQEVINEAFKLDMALQTLEEQNVSRKVVIMHYAPIEDTLIGEPVQIFSYLGSSYLADPLENRNVDVAFHGHAHKGTLKGITPGGVPVYNVALHVLRSNGFKNPFYLMEV